MLARFIADSQGDFGGNVDAGRLKEGEIELDLWATLPGFGLALHPIDSAEKTEPIVMSLADEEPIRGRIIDLEGRPLRDARVEVVRYTDTTTASIDKWLAMKLGKDAEYRNAILPAKPSVWVSAALIAPLRTNSEGRFELKGIGRDRWISLKISGPRVALTGAFVITRPIKPIPHRYFQTFGSQFERVVSQGVSLEGFVTDEESGRPIPGVRLDPSAWDYAPTTTDDRGHYRFDSLTPGSPFAFYLEVLELPYFSGIQNFPIPAGVSLEPIRKDFKLKRGVWAVGRAYDRVTGKPVSGIVFYNPYLSNAFARKFATNNPAFWQGLYYCGRADAEGRIRAVVIPGRGVISLQCETGDYRFNFGLAQIKEINDAIKAKRASPLYNPFWSERDQAVREINVAPGASETTIDLPVDPGQNIVLRFVDAAGNRLAGVDTYGLRSADARKVPGRDKSFAEGDSAILYATYPEETRTIWLRHRSSGLAKLFQFTAKAGETERTIILEPRAVATGRVVTSEGTPLSEIEVQCDVGGDSNNSFPPVLTDAQGRFRRDLPAGGPITVSFAGVRLPELTVVGREQIDFGEIAIERDAKQPWKSKVHRGPEKRTKPSAAAKASMASEFTSTMTPVPKGDVPKPAAPTKSLAVRGRVLLPNGQPAVRATVRVIRAEVVAGQFELRVLAKRTTDSNGDFESHIDAAGFKDRRPLTIWGTLPGYGLVVRPLGSSSDAQPIVLQLAQEEPIRGRIVDLEGRPVREARVELIRYFDTTTDSIDQWLAAISKLPRPINAFLDDEGDSAGRSAPGGPYLHVDSPQRVSETLVPTVKTDSDGRFEMRGLGRDRLIALRISASRTATIFASVLTRPIKSIPLPQWEVDGSEFTRVVSPSVPVEGFITDEESGKPIAGATVFPYIRSDMGRWRVELGLSASATTDARGHYLLEGLNTQQPNVCGVEPHDLPYLHPWYVKPMETGAGFEVPAAVALRPIRCDVKLKRGIWAVGRASDRVTGKPVSGWVQYTPFRSNEVARKYHVIQGTGGNVEADGRFRLLVVPGRGVLTLYCDEGDYRLQLGREAIADFEKLTSAPYAPYQVVREIDVPPDAEEAHADLAADPGQNVVLKFADPAGKPLAGVEAYGLRYVRYQSGKGYSARPWWSFVESDSATLYATFPGETRTVWLKHRASGLTKLFRFTPKEGETERTIVLEPPAVITARFLTPEGTPLANWSLTCTPAYNLPEGLRAASSDAQGRLRSEIPAGLFTSVFVTTLGWTQLEKNLKVAAGEQIDFGDVTVELDARQRRITKITRGSLKRSKSPGVANASTVQAPRPEVHLASAATEKKPAPPAMTTRELRGRVLLPNGQPAVGATVRVIKAVGQPYPAATEKFTVLTTLSADAKGEFRGSVDVGPMTDRRDSVNLWATLAGYGLALHPVLPAEKTDAIVMNLVDDEPIRGHIIDLEGRPLRDVRVEVVIVYDSTAAWVDQFIASAKDKPVYIHWFLPNRSLDENRGGREEAVFRVKAVASVSEALIPAQKTNADGRFEIQGIGRDRHVYLKISGPRMATFVASVVTRPIKPIPFRFHETLGSQFEHVASPSVPVEGFVTDEETGQPIPGVGIRPYGVKRGDSTLVGGNMFVSATSDPKGHFRLEGLDTGRINLCRILIPDLPYLSANEATIPASVSLEPIRLDIKLKRAIWAVGRAYDRSTGKPVSGSVVYTPFRSNEFAAKYFAGQPGVSRNSSPGAVGPDGRFRVPVIPGRGVVGLQCTQGTYRFNLGWAEIKELVDAERKGIASPTLSPIERYRFHSLREIDVAPHAHEVNVDLPVEPGQNVVLKFRDAVGKPLSGVEAVGLVLDPRILPPRSFTESDSATLCGTYPGDKRTVRLRHRASGLTRLIDFTPQPGETERTIVLEPPAVVTGRLVSEDRAPLSNVKIECFSLARSPTAITEADGHFRFEFPAGGPFELKARVVAPGDPVAVKLTVAAGDQIDLGTITIERGRMDRGFPKVHRGAVKRTTPPDGAKVSTESAPTSAVRQISKADALKHNAPMANAPTTLRGTVLRPDGQPAAGAEILALRSYWSSRVTWRPMATARTGAKGEFEIRVPRPGTTAWAAG